MGSLGGSNYIFPRFYRHSFVVAIDSFDDSTLNLIFTSINEWHFSKGYVEKVANLSRVSAKSGAVGHSIKVCRQIINRNIIHSPEGSQCSVCRNLSRSCFKTTTHSRKVPLSILITRHHQSGTGHRFGTGKTTGRSREIGSSLGT